MWGFEKIVGLRIYVKKDGAFGVEGIKGRCVNDDVVLSGIHYFQCWGKMGALLSCLGEFFTALCGR